MNCAICEPELEEEMRIELQHGLYKAEVFTGYHICPKCRIVYRGEE